MWFRNAVIYRIPQHTKLETEAVNTALSNHKAAPLASLDFTGRGWVPVFGDQLVYQLGEHLLINLRIDKKLLPASVINEALKERAQKFEEDNGFKPGRKLLKELKEDVVAQLLPTAFVVSTETKAWIDTARGWLVVDTASKTRAESVVGMLIKSLEALPLETLYVNKPIGQTLTGWLADAEAPFPFSVDQDAELVASGSGGAKVRYTRHSLETDEMQRHISAGKQCSQLALTWKDRISFVITDNCTVKRIKALDVVTETATLETNEDAFSTDFSLMTGELSGLFGHLIEAFGGIKPKEEPTPDDAPVAEAA